MKGYIIKNRFSDLDVQKIDQLNNKLILLEEKKRIVDPYKLLNIKGIWYLAGVEDGTLKTFSFSKIIDLEDTEESYVSIKRCWKT